MSNLKRTNESSLAIREAKREPWRDADWQNLWLVLRQKPWTSLAIVPAARGAPPDFTLTIAVTLARIGTMHLGTNVHVADASHLPIVQLEQFTDEVRRLGQEGEPVLVALSPIEENPLAVSIAKAAGAAVLCVLMEHMSSAQAKKTVDRIGSRHFLGSIVFHPEVSQRE